MRHEKNGRSVANDQAETPHQLNDERAAIAARLREARLAAGYRRAKEFAVAHGIPQPTYSMHEKGKRGLQPEVARRYADLLGVELSWLLTGATSSAPQNAIPDPYDLPEEHPFPRALERIRQSIFSDHSFEGKEGGLEGLAAQMSVTIDEIMEAVAGGTATNRLLVAVAKYYDSDVDNYIVNCHRKAVLLKGAGDPSYVPIIGEARLGTWREVSQFDSSSWMSLNLPLFQPYFDYPRHAIILKIDNLFPNRLETSLNHYISPVDLYGPSTVLICAHIDDLDPRHAANSRQSDVIVHRVNSDGLVEVFLARLNYRRGSRERGPSSYVVPFIPMIAYPDEEGRRGFSDLPDEIEVDGDGRSGSVRVVARVISVYRPVAFPVRDSDLM